MRKVARREQWGVKQFAVYTLSSGKKGTLYIGVTSNLYQRMDVHRQKLKGFTKKYDVLQLVYFEFFASAEEAIHREKRLKKYKREQKIKLIEAKNPDWQDLANDVIENEWIAL